jgi:hypothetical protein
MVLRATNKNLRNWLLICVKIIIAKSFRPHSYKNREVSMRRFGILAVSFAAMLMVCGAQDAFAQKKLTYEQAMAKCREDVRSQVSGSEGVGTAARYARAGACMHTYGYRLKRADRQNL